MKNDGLVKALRVVGGIVIAIAPRTGARIETSPHTTKQAWSIDRPPHGGAD